MAKQTFNDKQIEKYCEIYKASSGKYDIANLTKSAIKVVNNFTTTIINKDRLPTAHSLLDMIDDKISLTSEFRVINKCIGEILYRARIFDGYNEKPEIGFEGYNKSDSFVPPRSKTKNMRANFKNIPYLYCSDNPYIALSETRPRISMQISLAKIRVNEPLRIYNLSNVNIENSILFLSNNKAQIKNSIAISLIGDMFSKPVHNDDDPLEYFPTQFLADYIKKKGFDGIAYDSNYDQGMNYCIFNFDKCEAISSHLCDVTNVFFEAEHIEIDIRSSINKLLEDRLNGIDVAALDLKNPINKSWEKAY